MLTIVLALRSEKQPDLCDPAIAFRKWRVATSPQQTSSDDRFKAAAPVARALIGCDKPLLGMNRTELRAAFGQPAYTSQRVGDGSPMWFYDLGRTYPQNSSQSPLQVTFTKGRVTITEAPDLD